MCVSLTQHAPPPTLPVKQAPPALSTQLSLLPPGRRRIHLDDDGFAGQQSAASWRLFLSWSSPITCSLHRPLCAVDLSRHPSPLPPIVKHAFHCTETALRCQNVTFCDTVQLSVFQFLAPLGVFYRLASV